MRQEVLDDILPVLQRTETMYILEGTEYIYYDENTIGNAIDDWYIDAIRTIDVYKRQIADIAVKCFRKPFDIAMRQQKAGIMGSCQYGAGILGKKLFIGNIYAMLLQLFAHFLVAQIA